MANTVTQTTLLGDKKSRSVIRLITIIGDGSGEVSNLTIFSNSSFSGIPSRGSIAKITFGGSNVVGQLNWDQTTAFEAFAFNFSQSRSTCFKSFGGILNPNGTGATGNVKLSTIGLTSGATVSLIIEILQ